MTSQELTKLAETQWNAGFSDRSDGKHLWMNGFLSGYRHAQVDGVEEKLEKHHNQISNIPLGSVIGKKPIPRNKKDK